MKNSFLIIIAVFLFGLTPAVMAQSTEQIDREQEQLRTQLLELQRKKDSLVNAKAELENKIAIEKLLGIHRSPGKLEYNNAIGFDPVASLYYLGASFTYERALGEKQSLRLSLVFYDYSGTDTYRDTERDRSYLKASMGYRALLEYRIYLAHSGSVFKGPYVGPWVLYKQRVEEVSENLRDTRGYYNYTYRERTRFGSALGFGGVIGYAVPMSNRFVFDAYVQIGATIGLGDREDAPIIGRFMIDPYNTSTFLGTGITLGYKF